jgi:tetratricopeptide (TPR) repeat protein
MPKRRSLVAAGLVCLSIGVSTACPATAQEPDTNAVMQPDIKAIVQLLESGNHAAALVEAQKFEAAAKAQFGVNHTTYAYALSVLATVYVTQEKFDEAETLFRRAMAIRAKVLGDDHPDVAHSLTILAGVYRMHRKDAEAERLLRRALEIQTRALGDNDFTVYGTLMSLALACLAQGKDQEADALRERAMSIINNAMNATGRK